MKFFDSHCHLQMPQFNSDREEVIKRMEEREMGGVIPGVDFATSVAAIALAEKHAFLWAAVGLHPNEPSTNSGQATQEEFDTGEFLKLAQNPKVVAIGECGLDYFRSGGTPEEKAAQKKRFGSQIELALKVKKPLIVHCRNAHDDCFSILQNYKIGEGGLQVVIHFATMTGELAEKYLALGCYLSFPGPITYTDHRNMRDPALGGGMYDASIIATPLDKILSETDSPFAAPVPYRGQRNEPAYVEEVVKKIAQLKNMSQEDMGAQITLNSQRIFGISN